MTVTVLYTRIVVDEVITQWEREHPGKTVRDMPPGELGRRVMAVLKAEHDEAGVSEVRLQ